LQDLQCLKSPGFGDAPMRHKFVLKWYLWYGIDIDLNVPLAKQLYSMRKMSPMDKHEWFLCYILVEGISLSRYYFAMVGGGLVISQFQRVCE